MSTILKTYFLAKITRYGALLEIKYSTKASRLFAILAWNVRVTFGAILAKFVFFTVYTRCLHRTRGIMQLEMVTSCHVIMACCVLHNMATRAGVPHPDPIDDEARDEYDAPQLNHRHRVDLRNQLINRCV